MGQLMHLFESPNRFGLPPFYTLHVWAWKENPTGMFVNWHKTFRARPSADRLAEPPIDDAAGVRVVHSRGRSHSCRRRQAEAG